jgi:DNA-binding beta-propeller fold protein YncE
MDPGQFNWPYGLTVDSQGDLYVVERLGNRVQKLSPDGAPLAQWGSFGHDPGEFDTPLGVAVDDHGNIYVVDRDNRRVQELSAAGDVVDIFTGYGGKPGIATPTGNAPGSSVPFARLCPL